MTWNIILSTGRSDLLAVEGLPWPVALRPHPTARTLRLRLDERGARLLLSYPRRMARRTALEWARRQGEWASGQIARIGQAVPFVDGAVVPIRGAATTLRWLDGAPRTATHGDGVLAMGGPRESFGARVGRLLKSMARDELSQQTAQTAARAGVSVLSVTVGDATSRWGSCSESGAIRYNWRLILAPPHVLEWVVAHEVAHRTHMNHGREFRELEARLYGRDVAAARAELRRLGPDLKRIGLPA